MPVTALNLNPGFIGSESLQVERQYAYVTRNLYAGVDQLKPRETHFTTVVFVDLEYCCSPVQALIEGGIKYV